MRKERSLRVLIVGHRGIVQESLARMLSTQPDVELVSQHTDVDHTFSIHRFPPSSVILANHDPEWDEPLERLMDWAVKHKSAKKVLLLTVGIDRTTAARLLLRGIGGLCLKRNSLDLLMEAIRSVGNGDSWIDPAIQASDRNLADSDSDAGHRLFTDRELLALRALVEGCSNKEIGARLGASEAAGKGVLQRLFRKTHVRSRGQLIRVALEKYRDLL